MSSQCVTAISYVNDLTLQQEYSTNRLPNNEPLASRTNTSVSAEYDALNAAAYIAPLHTGNSNKNLTSRSYFS